MTQGMDADSAAIRQALEMVTPGTVIGLGTGRAATAFVHALGRQYQEGLAIRGVPTSDATATLARSYGIPLVGLDEVAEIEIAFDGADEIDPRCDLIKGYGGALLREKIVAAASKRLVILGGPEKLVPSLGARGMLPVEVAQFGMRFCHRRLESMGFSPRLRRCGEQPFITENANFILDCGLNGILFEPDALDRAIRDIPGVVATGLFIRMADTVLIQDGDTVKVLRSHGWFPAR